MPTCGSWGERMIKLKPCPFCGRVEAVDCYQISHEGMDNFWYIGCEECGVLFGISGRTEEDAVETWNRISPFRQEDDGK